MTDKTTNEGTVAPAKVSPDRDGPNAVWILTVTAALITAAWLGFYSGLTRGEWSESSPNGVGDAFNVLTSLFTGLALAAVAVSIYFQRRDLHATLREMALTRREMDESQELQSEQIHVQRLVAIADLEIARQEVLESRATKGDERAAGIAFLMEGHSDNRIEAIAKVLETNRIADGIKGAQKEITETRNKLLARASKLSSDNG